MDPYRSGWGDRDNALAQVYLGGYQVATDLGYASVVSSATFWDGGETDSLSVMPLGYMQLQLAWHMGRKGSTVGMDEKVGRQARMRTRRGLGCGYGTLNVPVYITRYREGKYHISS